MDGNGMKMAVGHTRFLVERTRKIKQIVFTNISHHTTLYRVLGRGGFCCVGEWRSEC